MFKRRWHKNVTGMVGGNYMPEARKMYFICLAWVGYGTALTRVWPLALESHSLGTNSEHTICR